MIKSYCEKNGIKYQEMSSEKAFFQNGQDEKRVIVPLKSQFENLDTYYAIAFHELAHSTKTLGIRINTKTDTPKGNVFGSKNYAKEELTAELTSLFLCREFNMDSSELANTKNNSFAYLKNWIEGGDLEKNDLSIAIQEANRASKALLSHVNKLKLSQEEKLTTQEKITVKESKSVGMKI